MSLIITKGFKPEDIDPLHELENRCFTKAFRWAKEDLVEALQTNDIWIGVYDGKIVGCVLIEAEGNNGHVISLNVDPNFRRMGFGKSLMETAEIFYKKQKLKTLWLEVHSENAAQILYFNMGYRVTGFKAGYYANGSNAVIMTKVLRR